jgi:hypothetical protein
MTKIEKLKRSVRESFSDKLMAAFKVKFRRNLTTSYNIFGMALVSRPSNGKPFTPKQKEWVAGYETGYLDAQNQIGEQHE